MGAAAGEGLRGGGTRGGEVLGTAALWVVGAPGVPLGPFYMRPRRWRWERDGGGGRRAARSAFNGVQPVACVEKWRAGGEDEACWRVAGKAWSREVDAAVARALLAAS